MSDAEENGGVGPEAGQGGGEGSEQLTIRIKDQVRRDSLLL
jgi:hypothetical protein